MQPIAKTRPAAFFDRDGVLNHDAGHVCRRENFVWLAGAKQAIKRLNDLEYLVFVITNQSAVARGLCTEVDVQALHGWMNADLGAEGAHIDAFYYCPHHPSEGIGLYRQSCSCRKPAPGMLIRAMEEWPIDRAASFMIGDQDTDIAAATAAGVIGVRTRGGSLDDLVSEILAGSVPAT